MRISTLLLLTVALAVAAPALAQEGGMGGADMGRGRGGNHHRGQGQKPAEGQAGAQSPMRAPAEVPVAMRLTGKVVVSGATKALAHTLIAADRPDLSAVYAERSAQLSLDAVDLSGAGDVSLIGDGRTSGLDSALLVGSRAQVTMTGGHISTTGKGANAAFVGDPGSKLSLKDVDISTHAGDAYGIEAAGGGTVSGDGLTVATAGDRATAVAVQTPDSQATLGGGHVNTRGANANAFFVAGALDVSGVTAETADADGLMADAARGVSLTDTGLSAGGYGVVLYAGDPAVRGDGGGPAGGEHDRHGGEGPGMGPGAPAARASDAMPLTEDVPLRRTRFTMTGGALKARRALFYVTNLHADITLDHVALQDENGVLVRSAADHWGPLGRNGGDVRLVTRHETLTGDFATDVISSISLSLTGESVLTGATTANVDVDMDASSKWVLTGDTRVGKLVDAAITADDVPNIVGNGHTLTYDHRHNPQLGGRTYALAGGGQLVPGGL
jgi:hypothetical protein